MPGPLRVVVVGGEAAGARALGMVLAHGYEVPFVVADGARGETLAAAASRAHVPLEPPDPGQARLAARLDEERVDLLLNVHSLTILRPDALRAPRIGSFNLHPGPLPSFAGLDAPSWAIYEGTASYGCTVHWMEEVVDAGAVAYAASFPVEPRETGLTLNARCATVGLELLGELLRDAALGAIPATPQEAEGRRVLRRGPPDDGIVDWTAPAVALDRYVRACDFGPLPSPWAPAPRTWLDGRELRIVRAEATAGPASEPGLVSVEDDAVFVATGDGRLRVDAVAVGGRARPAAGVLTDGALLSLP